jgi:hypothetical protein
MCVNKLSAAKDKNLNFFYETIFLQFQSKKGHLLIAVMYSNPKVEQCYTGKTHKICGNQKMLCTNKHFLWDV